MRHKLFLVLLIILLLPNPYGIVSGWASEQGTPVKGRTFYVRQTVGNDKNDGLTSETAWLNISKLSKTMEAGDTAYIGPGLYRDHITVWNDGTAENRIRIIADTTGQYTGDPPGVVMITGADPVDESIFIPHSEPGVYKAEIPSNSHVSGVVEMDGPQYRYRKASDMKEYLIDKLSELEVVVKLPSSFDYDRGKGVVYIHTSDGKPPTEHEIEFIRRGIGISTTGKQFITIIGFTFRHVVDAGISFFKESGNVIAINNTSYGSRQGIRVYNATNVLIYGNTLFRNDNCGVYFAKESTNGYAINNILYENVKGVRWSSDSANGLAIGNSTFDNHEAGISIEKTNNIRVSGNTIVNNDLYQLLVLGGQYHSEGNCFENGNPEQLTAIIDFTKKFKTLSEYQRETQQDQGSRENKCGKLPEKIDVRKLHEETMSYTEKARKILKESH